MLNKPDNYHQVTYLIDKKRVGDAVYLIFDTKSLTLFSITSSQTSWQSMDDMHVQWGGFKTK